VRWWDGYRDVKHTESVNLTQGNLKNALTALAAVAVLVDDRVLDSGSTMDLPNQVLESTFMPRVWTVPNTGEERLFE
jgi:hypothetical protein